MASTNFEPAVHDSQPKAIPSPEAHQGFGARAAFIKKKLTTRRGWLGDYDYAWLCLPTLPFVRRSTRPPPFYALDAELPLTLAIFTGFQHALAMLAGLITPPIIFASALNLDSATSAYMVSASLIGCGILSLVQMSRIPLFGGYYLGTGLISVVGTSFSTLSTANGIFDAMYRDGTCSSTTAPDGTITRDPCPDAYGKVLGTSLICAFLEIGLAFLPPRVLKRIFPPIVTGTVILLIGTSLVGNSGALDWGGGANGCQNFPTSGIFQLCPTTLAPRPLPWGSPEFIGLGFLSFISIILTELFGSPFMKNISIIVGLAVGCIVAGAAGYIDGSSIKSAPAITFLWVHTFKISVYPPAILPMLAVYVSLAMEATGDITASAEVSRLPVDGIEFDSRVQGGILSDGIGGFLSALFTVTPLSIFAQNNGVIAITRCANRSAGRWCCAFLILFGIIGKISGFFLAIPNPVLGGVTTFLFASVAVSGLRVLSYAQFTRRDRFVLAAALSFGLADVLVPEIFTHLFDRVENPSSGLQGLFNSITIILSTPFLAAGIVASVLNVVLPRDMEDAVDGDDMSQELVSVYLEQRRTLSSEEKAEV
ncbi:xanthine uracil permease [Daedaleopsis nitida]|nr:xanthine uracil permease [Daedaleopsis nitida]